ncbi:MAG: PrgI family protein [Candidatus Vogelbacteria bacterium]|nr:PrgI family protein [Candidatus Vogelbacteria bacterium]
MQFQVPQFIEVEDKLFGPFTFKQFVYLLGAGGFAFIVYTYVEGFYTKVLLIAPVSGFGLALAFLKVNDRPFINYLESAVRFYLGNKLYVWRKEPKETQKAKETTTGETPAAYTPKLTAGKLKDLSWSLDIHGKIPAPINNITPKQ